MAKLHNYCPANLEALMKVLCAGKWKRAGRLTLLGLEFWCLALATTMRAQSASDVSQADLHDGMRLLQSGQPLKAKNKFDSAIKSQPGSANALTLRGICENQLQQYAEAETDFEAALHLDATMLSAHYNLALSFIRLNKIEKAIGQLRIVIAAQPKAVLPIYNLAILLENQSLFTEAVEQLGVAHALAPEDKGVTLHLMIDEVKLQRADTLPPLISNLADHATPAEMQRQAGQALFQAGRFHDAVVLLQAAHDREPTANLADLTLARALISDGRAAEAIELLRSANLAEPANAFYSLELARVLLATDQAEEAKPVLSKASFTGLDQAQQLTLMGIASVATHDIAVAMPQLEKALQEDPNLALAQNVLGFCYLQQGQYAMAAEAYSKASDLEPSRALYARAAALALERANQDAQAMHYAERAKSLDSTDAGSHALLGKLYAALGRNEEAVSELLIAVKLNRDLDSAIYLLARTYQRLGDRQQAAAWSERLSALKQKHEAAFGLEKQAAANEIRSSILLNGSSLSSPVTGSRNGP